MFVKNLKKYFLFVKRMSFKIVYKYNSLKLRFRTDNNKIYRFNISIKVTQIQYEFLLQIKYSHTFWVLVMYRHNNYLK